MGSADDSRRWRSLRFRSWLLLLFFLLYMPFMALGVFVLDAMSPGLGHRDSFWLFAIWGLAMAAASVYQISFRCPGCGGWFGSSDRWTSPIARRCLHCGLKRYGSSVGQAPVAGIENRIK